MSIEDRTLVVIPALRAARPEKDLVVLTRKFLSGLNEFHRGWPGPLRVFMLEAPPSKSHSIDNLDYIQVSIRDLGFHLRVGTASEIAEWLGSCAPATAILSLDDPTQSLFASVCHSSGIHCAYVTENSFQTRIQMIKCGTANPLLRARRKLWQVKEERRRVVAIRQSIALQCNGTPTYADYKNLCTNSLLFFDSRMTRRMLATEDQIRERTARAGDNVNLLYSGRLEKIKGVEHLLKVAIELRRAGARFHLYICGGGSLEEKMRKMIIANSLERHVTMKGILDFESELIPFAKRDADLFLCCHPQGDPSCTYMETFSCGLPIVGYANSALTGLVECSGGGWSSPINNVRRLASLVAHIIKSPSDLLSRSLLALRFAEQNTFEATFQKRTQQLRFVSATPAQPILAART